MLDPRGVTTRNSAGEIHGFVSGGGPARAEVALWTDDVDKALESLMWRGVGRLSAPHDFGAVRGAWVTNPDGNPIRIVAKAKGR